jgi:hypothetical protein
VVGAIILVDVPVLDSDSTPFITADVLIDNSRAVEEDWEGISTTNEREDETSNAAEVIWRAELDDSILREDVMRETDVGAI